MAVLFYFGPGTDLTNSSHYLDKFYSLSAQVILFRTYHAEHVCSSLVAVPNTEFPGNAWTLTSLTASPCGLRFLIWHEPWADMTVSCTNDIYGYIITPFAGIPHLTVHSFWLATQQLIGSPWNTQTNCFGFPIPARECDSEIATCWYNLCPELQCHFFHSWPPDQHQPKLREYLEGNFLRNLLVVELWVLLGQSRLSRPLPVLFYRAYCRSCICLNPAIR